MAITRFNAKNGLSVGTGSIGVIDSVGNAEFQALGVTGSITPAASGLYDIGSSTRQWRNMFVTNISGSITGSGLLAGQVVVAGTGGVLSGSNNLVWSDANRNVGINTSSGFTNSALTIGHNSLLAPNGARALTLKTLDSSISNGTLVWVNNADQVQVSWGRNYNVSQSLIEVVDSTSATRFMVNSAANVGIGTTSYVARLFVSGSSTSSTPTMVVREGVVSPTGGAAVLDIQNSAGASLLFVSGSGNVGIGTSAGLNNRLTVYGSTDSGNTLGIGDGPTRGIGAMNGRVAFYTAASANLWAASIRSYVPAGSAGIDFADLRFYTTHGAAIDQERVRITTDGKVGVGITNPGQNLTVIGNFSVSNSGTAQAAYFSHSSSTTNVNLVSNGVINIINNDSTAGNITPVDFYNSTSNVVARIAAINEDQSTHAGSLAFVTRASIGSYGERLRITSGGNVGIGITNPSVRLDIASGSMRGYYYVSTYDGELLAGADAGGYYYATGFGKNTSIPILIGSNATNIIMSAGGSERMRVAGSTGFVGIGTNNPARPLHVNGSLRLSNSSVVEYGGTSASIAGESSTNTLFFNTNSTERVRIDSSGNVGVGTVSPNARLDVSGSSTASTPTMVVREGVASPTGGVGVFNVQNFAGTSLFFVSGSGNVGIGSASPVSLLNIRGASPTFVIDDTATGTSTISFRPQVTSYAERASLSVNYSTAEMRLSVGVAPNTYFQTFYTNGFERVRIDASGNVGIGTNSIQSYSGYTVLDINNATNSGLVNFKKNGTTTSYLHGNGGLTLLSTSGNSLQIITAGSNPIYFRTNATDRVLIDSSGNLTPYTDNTYDLGSSNLRWRTVFAANISGSLTGSNVTAGQVVVAGAGGVLSGSNNLFWNNSSGSLGIGTSASTAKFEVVGVSGSLFSVTDQLSGSLFSVNTISGLPILEVFSDNNVVAGAYGSNALVVTGSSVGIGTSLPQAKLDIRGAASTYTLLVSGSTTFGSSFGQIINAGSNSGDVSLRVRNYNGTSDYFMVRGDGNVGIATASPLTSAGNGLTIYGSTNGSLYLQNSSNHARIFAQGNELYIDNGTGGSAGSIIFRRSSSTTESARIDSSGNLGVGTTNPGTRLDVAGAARSTYGVFSGSLAAYASSTGALYAYYVNSTSVLLSSADNSATAAPLDIFTGASRAMRIDTAQNVGIGTVTYTARLFVSGTSTASTPTMIVREGVANPTGGADILDIQNYLGTSIMVVTGSGRVGIGTTNPTTPLHVNATGTGLSGTGFRIADFSQDQTNGRGIMLGYDSSGQIGLIAPNSTGPVSSLAFWTNSATGWGERMRLDSAGNLLVRGTTQYGSAKLQVVYGDDSGGSLGYAQIGLQYFGGGYSHYIQSLHNTVADDGNAIRFYLNTSNTAGGSSAVGTGNALSYFMGYSTHRWNTGGSERARIDSSGNVGIGTATISARLQIQGSSTASTPTMIVREGVSSPLGGAGVLDVQKSSGASILFVSGSGNVGVGVNNPIVTLHVANSNGQGDAAIIGSTSVAIKFGVGHGGNGSAYVDAYPISSPTTSPDYFAFRMAGTERVRIDSSGNLVPGANASYDIGLMGTRWRDVYARSGSFTGDITISGNLTVAGTQTIVNSETVNIKDNIILLNSTASPQQYGGIYVADTTVNTTGSLRWNSSTDRWEAGLAGSEAALPTGSGTTGYLTRWATSSTFGNSAVYDDGSSAIIGATTGAAGARLHLVGGGIVINDSGSLHLNGNQNAIVGASRRLNYGDLLLGYNLRGNPGDDTYRTHITNAAAGYAGLDLQYTGIIKMYSFSGATTAGATVTPNQIGQFDTTAVWLSPRVTNSDFYINSSGNVGIGTTTPSGVFNVRRDTAAGRSNVTFENGAAANASNRMRLRLSPSLGFIGIDVHPYIESYCENPTGELAGLAFGTWNGTNNNERMRIDASGNVGVGTTVPGAILHTLTSGNTTGIFASTASRAWMELRRSTSTTLGYIGTGGGLVTGAADADLALRCESGNILFSSVATELMRIDSSGRVGINTTSMTLKLEVSGSDARIHDVRIGRGAGSISSNTVLGASISSAISGGSNTFIGNSAGNAVTSAGTSTFVGETAGFKNSTGNSNTYIGRAAGWSQLGSNNTAVGQAALNGLTDLSVANNNTSIGYQSGYSVTSGGQNVFVGHQSGYNTSVATYATAVGYRAGYSLTSGSYNVLIGDAAGSTLTTGGSNTLLGHQAGMSATTVSGLVYIGSNAGVYQSGAQNTAVGQDSLFGVVNNTNDATLNTAIGNSAGFSVTTGGSNFFGGHQAGYSNSVATNGVLIGYRSGYNVTSGSFNVLVGNRAGENVTTGQQNTFLGYLAGGTGPTTQSSLVYVGSTAGIYQRSTGNTALGVASLYGVQGVSNATNNTAVGYYSGFAVTTGGNNFFGGYQAGTSNTTGISNVMIGYQSGYVNSTGNYNTYVGNTVSYASTSGSFNVVMGHQAAAAAVNAWYLTYLGVNSGFWQTGGNNTAIGHNALVGSSGASATNNTAIGKESGYSVTTGGSNFFGGYQAGYSQSTATNNTLVGNQAGVVVTSGSNNTFIGSIAGQSTTTGANNTFLGYGAGNTTTTGNNNIYLGVNSTGTANNNTNETVIGFTATGRGSNTTTIGNGSITLTMIPSGSLAMGGNAAGNNAVSLGLNNTASGNQSVAIGNGNTASAIGSFALGTTSTASTGGYNFAIGSSAVATGITAVAMGLYTTASGASSFVAGRYSLASGAQSVAIGSYVTGSNTSAVAIGNNSTSSATGSIALGAYNTASGTGAAAIGGSNVASGGYAFAAGYNSTASGFGSISMGGGANVANTAFAMAFGSTNTASGVSSVAMGQYNNASGAQAIAIGQYATGSVNNAVAIGSGSLASGVASIAFGELNTSSATNSVAIGKSNSSGGSSSTAIGRSNSSTGSDSIAIGAGNISNNTSTAAIGASNTASGNTSFAAGFSNTASNFFSVALGAYNASSGFYSFAAGSTNTASGTSSVAMGQFSLASGAQAIAIGNAATGSFPGAIAIGSGSLASNTEAVVLGPRSTASAISAIAIGNSNTANALLSNAIGGISNTASGIYSVTLGSYTQASGYGSLATGIHSIAYLKGQRAHAAEYFATGGDAQISSLVSRNSTTNASPTELFTNGSSQRLVLPASTTWDAEISVVARASTGTSHASFRRRCLISRDGSNTTTLVGPVQVVGSDIGSNFGSPPSGWTVTISADDTNESLNITVTGAASTNIRWVARIELVEVRY